MSLKTCIGECKQELPISCFQFRTDTKKYRNECRNCRSSYLKQYRKDINSGKRTKYVIIMKNGKKLCVVCGKFKPLSQYPKRNTQHGYRHNCKQCKKDYMSNYYIEVYNYVRNKRKKEDPNYKLKCLQRCYIYKSLFYGKGKTKSTLQYLGISLDLLRKWLEFQFDDDMNWANHGELWTIDHIVPLYHFDLTDEYQQDLAFSWRNLQPLKDNFVKNNKIRMYEYFNSLISSVRFIRLHSLNEEYQGVKETLYWLREKLRDGKELQDKGLIIY